MGDARNEIIFLHSSFQAKLCGENTVRMLTQNPEVIVRKSGPNNDYMFPDFHEGIKSVNKDAKPFLLNEKRLPNCPNDPVIVRTTEAVLTNNDM
uniref:Uncharacterized protein n=1 Tax=Panagrolaimus sp. JU765 TaxID=591449 RepID=A0AC34RJX5_9BILA